MRTRLDLGCLPIWKGVQASPGLVSRPFVLQVERGLIRLELPQQVEREIVAEYAKDSYQFITAPPGSSAWGDRLGDVYFRHWATQAGSLHGMDVLEIGSGTLYMAERARLQLGVRRFVACDPALRGESAMPGVLVKREYFGPDSFRDDTFDWILSVNNLEHIPDLWVYLTTVRRLLAARHGRLYVVVPDCTRGLKTGDVGILVHEHLTYFTPVTLGNLLADCGLAVEWLLSEEDTLFAIARPSTGPRPDAPEAHQEQLLMCFGDRVLGNLESARRLIDDRTQLGFVALHGCGVGLNSVLALMEMRSNPRVFLFDSDSAKAGCFLPAFDAAIRHSSHPDYRRVQTVIIAALTYYREITEYVKQTHGISSDNIYPIFPVP